MKEGSNVPPPDPSRLYNRRIYCAHMHGYKLESRMRNARGHGITVEPSPPQRKADGQDAEPGFRRVG